MVNAESRLFDQLRRARIFGTPKQAAEPADHRPVAAQASTDTSKTEVPPTLAAKLNRLFSTFHSRDENEQSSQAVADAVSRQLRRVVPAHQIEQLRGEDVAVDTTRSSPGTAELLAAIAGHFRIPREYLTTSGATAAGIHRELRVLAAGRDAHVESVALRGGGDLDALAQLLESVRLRKPHT